MPTALVTGAGTGIGAEAAKLLACTGYDLVLMGRRREPLEAVRDVIGSAGGSARIAIADVADFKAVDRAVSALSSLDVVINNAGVIGPIAALVDTDARSWTDALLVNLVGPYHVARASIPLLLASGNGTLINVSSGAAGRPIRGWSSYCASKAGLAMLTQSIWLEYGDAGLRVFGLRPGLVDTPMRESIRALDATRRHEDRSRLNAPGLLAKAIVWLCSAEGNNVIGREIDLDELEKIGSLSGSNR